MAVGGSRPAASNDGTFSETPCAATRIDESLGRPIGGAVRSEFAIPRRVAYLARRVFRVLASAGGLQTVSFANRSYPHERQMPSPPPGRRNRFEIHTWGTIFGQRTVVHIVVCFLSAELESEGPFYWLSPKEYVIHRCCYQCTNGDSDDRRHVTPL